MYSYLFFGLSLLSMFLIIENIKWNQKISIIKLHIIILLLSLMGSSFFQFLDEIGKTNKEINIVNYKTLENLIQKHIYKKNIIYKNQFLTYIINLFFNSIFDY